MDARQIVQKPTASLVPFSGNARTHSEAQVAQIAASIREFGWTNPILTNGDGVIAGHGRLAAAVKLGMETVPCLDLVGLSPSQARAYVIADNRLALNAGWDDEILSAELMQLQETDFDLTLLGFSDDELAELMADRTIGLTDPDAAPEAPANPVSVFGDCWILGRHRILCGDSTVATDVERVLGDVKPHLMVTDPPYGVEYDPTWRQKTGHIGVVANDDRADWREAWALFPGDVAYVWHASLHARSVIESLEVCAFEVRAQIIWAKPNLQMSRGHYHWQHEPCWYAVKKGGTGHWSGDRKQTTLWQISSKNQDSDTVHGTQKPVECMRRPIENNSSAGQAVYEPFSGSGTTIIAAEMTGRACHAIELSPAYVDVAIIRWQDFTGKPAMLESTGQTFAEVAAERVETAVAA